MLAVRPEVPRVDRAGEHAHDRGLDAGERRDHLGDVAVGDHELRVRVHRVERVDAEHVRGRLQPPPVRRTVPLQQLHHASVVAVRRAVVAVEQPLAVRRRLRDDVELRAAEREVDELEALRRAVGRRRQHRLELGRHVAEALHHLLGGEEPRVGRLGRERRAVGSVVTPPTGAGSGPRDPGRGGS